MGSCDLQNDFQCTDFQCIKLYLVCDRVNNFQDESDENEHMCKV